MGLWLKTDTGIVPVNGGAYLQVTPWTNVTFQNGWANGVAGTQNAQYRRFGDMIQLRGYVAMGTNSTTIFTLPVGFRPPGSLDIPANNWNSPNTSYGRIYVNTDGTVNGYVSSGGGYLSYCCEFSVTDTGQYPSYTDAPRQGLVGYAQITSNSVAFSALTLISGLSITWTAVAGRRYSLRFSGEIIQGVATDVWVMSLEDTSATLKRITACNNNTSSTSVEATYITNASISGSKTWRLNGVRAGGTGTITVGASSTYPAYLAIEDLGPL
jgi:hypothetical protein